ncbi:cyclohexanone monooxygenase [Trichoderma arundinaceum]|uniref:Cyclohexanone monooxygenase n=1 Tax=Trichoderma arundinaceum TaxID=490622 RepID=A0A395NWN1_TRIAR|nr:cyclohexanone monooxygenase [Trichoderma arundinaceum]
MSQLQGPEHPQPPVEPDLDTTPRLHPLKTQRIDIKSIESKYERERAKRLRSDGVAQFQSAKGNFSRFRDDIGAAPITRESIVRETKVLIVGAGFGGVVMAVRLREQGVEDFVILDKASGFGGTWYWNQYPGVCCDVESYIYLPFLEETNYIPTTRFASGPEILEHIGRVVDKWRLASNAYLQTQIISMKWDETIRRWHVYTNRSDHFITQFVVMATGTLHEPQLPRIPGINEYERPLFHIGRWNYSVTGGNSKGNMRKLADKTVGIIGTGASGVSVIPLLAQSAKKLLVFQRTPSTIDIRENWKTDANFLPSLLPGWQRAQMETLANVLEGDMSDVECSAVEGLDVLALRGLFKEAKQAGVDIKPEEIPELMKLANLRWMERIRKLIEDKVEDKETAEKLKPWYSFMCKRPVFHNEYLASFNKPNVELVDTDGKGVSSLTSRGVMANGKEYEVDILIFATGFEFYLASDYEHRTGIRVIGSRNESLDEAWRKEGPRTLFGIHFRDFPNLFNVGSVQSGVGATWTHTTYVAGEHIADVIASVLSDGDCDTIEPSEEAVLDWGNQMEEGGDLKLHFHQSCTPSYYNAEGNPEQYTARWGTYPKGIMQWTRILKEWREEGNMKGIEKR